MAPRPEAPLERLLQRFVARGLAQSPRAAALLSELRARRLVIEVRGTPWSLVLESTGDTLTMAPTPTDGLAALRPTDARMLGSPWSLLALTGEDARAVIQRGDVRIDGDGAVAERFQELLRHLRPDLEDVLSQLLGRSLAHVLVRTLHGASGWARATARTGARNVAEYLAHETGDLVPLAEAEQFLRGVDELRDALERADARARDLEQRMQALAGSQGPA
jgi:ubiquinone biosynthesis accessory factor UbiJ